MLICIPNDASYVTWPYIWHAIMHKCIIVCLERKQCAREACPCTGPHKVLTTCSWIIEVHCMIPICESFIGQSSRRGNFPIQWKIPIQRLFGRPIRFKESASSIVAFKVCSTDMLWSQICSGLQSTPSSPMERFCHLHAFNKTMMHSSVLVLNIILRAFSPHKISCSAHFRRKS